MSYLRTAVIRKSFGPVEVLHGIDFSVDAGSVVALLGENGAGKSTLVKILAGDLKADSGELFVDGEHRTFGSVGAAREAGIRLISQEIADAPTLTVAENVVLGSWPGRRGLVSRTTMREEAARLLDRLKADIPLNKPVGELRLGERQTVEIARALAGRSRCLIFDEPTAALSDIEASRLFEVIASLRTDGVAIVYITHRLDEVFRIADRTSVLRDGRISLDQPTAELDTATVVEAMVGRKVAAQRYVASSAPPGAGGVSPAEPDQAPRLELRSAGGLDFDGVDVDVRPGEVVGLYGKVGSGATEVAESIFGVRKVTSGDLLVQGRPVRLHGPADAIRHGIGFLPPDRQRQAVLQGRSVAENLTAPSWRRLSALGLMTKAREASAYRRWHDVLSVRSTASPDQSIGTLSGGNQQKVLLGRWLEAGAKILVLAEPTRGVDVGARQEIYQAVRRLADDGAAVVVATSDYEDIVAVADRVHVMVRGTVVTTLRGDEVTVARLTEAAGGAVHVVTT
jgi:ribose transport system ATP-binding protein